MAENTFLETNPQFAGSTPTFNNAWGDQIRNDNGFLTGHDDNVISRWWNPEIAEKAQFDKENYFVDKANAFNEYMYNKQLEDNSAAAQMERAREAGINLNLAAGGIMGSGNAVAQAMPGAQGGAAMNTNAQSPFQQAGELMGAIKTGISGVNELGEILGFGKKNKAEIKQLEESANKVAQEAGLTFLQRKQYQKLMPILYSQAVQDLTNTRATLDKIKSEIKVYNEQIKNIAEDTKLKTAQTGEVKQKTRTEYYNAEKAKFEDMFRKLFGVEISNSGLSMIVQAVLSGKGEALVEQMTNGIIQITKATKNNIKDNIIDILNPLDDETTNRIKKTWEKLPGKIKRRYKDFKTFQKRAINKIRKEGKNALNSMKYWS